MKMFLRALLGCAIAAAPMVNWGQAVRPTSSGSGAASTTRYFQLMVVLRYPANESPEPRTESITTEVTIMSDGRTGSSKTRMTSQVPMVMAGATKFVELGTKFDCNNVRIDGDGLALSVVLETSLVNGFVTTKNSGGVETEEPLISQRNLELAVKLPLDTTKIIFDSKNMSPKLLPKKIGSDAAVRVNERVPEPTLQIEMTAKELK